MGMFDFNNEKIENSAHWEEVLCSGKGRPQNLVRAKVPGGWLVESRSTSAYGGLTFMPDPEHLWLQEEEK